MLHAVHGEVAFVAKTVERLALAGLTLATVGLGALALWSATVTQDSAAGLSEAGVQTSGHLRSVQALTAIDRETDTLGETFDRADLTELLEAERILADALARMERGDVLEARRIAREARPMVAAMHASIEDLLRIRGTRDPERLEVADDATDETIEELQLHLTDADFDPSGSLTQFDPVVVRAFVSVERDVLAGAGSSGSVSLSLSFPR